MLRDYDEDLRGGGDQLNLMMTNNLLQCNVVNKLLRLTKESYYSTLTEENSSVTRVLFRAVNKFLNNNADQLYPTSKNNEDLVNTFADFF